MKHIIYFFIFVYLFGFLGVASAQGTESAKKAMSLEKYVSLAVKNDTEFEKILIDELSLQYKKDIELPAKDFVLSIKGQYDFILDADREEPASTVSLTKLFPWTGTSLEAEYSSTPSYTSVENSSAFNFEVSQPIAQNAFGKATRLKDKIAGVEIDVAKHQIIEAYEDYLAAIIIGYYDWYEAYENLNIAESSYKENIKLLDNIRERKNNNIALPIDVNKVHLQVLAKKEKLVELQNEYESAWNFIKNAIRFDSDIEIIPEQPSFYKIVEIDFENDFAEFKNTSRTFQVLNLLEEKTELEVDEEADDLLPSIDLLFGYNVKGKDFDIKNEDNMVYAGLSMELPLGHQIDRAEYEQARIAFDKQRLSNKGTYFSLYSDLKDTYLSVKKEKALLDIAKEKIALAKSILDDETENYSFGKVTLNDYIDAVNVVDTNRFNMISHESECKKQLIEWLRLTDKLISKKEIEKSK